MTEDLAARLLAAIDTAERDAHAEKHQTDSSEAYSCPATRTGPLGDLPFGEDNCTCGLATRQQTVLRRCAADRKILTQQWDYAAEVDSEWGCGHSAQEIERGECHRYDPATGRGLPLLAALAEGYGPAAQPSDDVFLPTTPMFRATWHSEAQPDRPDRRLYESNWTPAARPVLIFAKGYPYARNVARAYDLNPQQWRYIPDVQRLRGLEGGRYYLDDSSFWERPDAAEMLAVLRTRRMTEMTIADLGALKRG